MGLDHPGVDFTFLGRRFRAVRIRRRWRQQDLAERAGVSRTVVSRIELGQWTDVSMANILAVAQALGIRLRLSASWEGSDLDRMISLRHSLLHEAVSRKLGRLPGWELAPEVSYASYGERGVIDILAWHAPGRLLLVIELKTEIVDVNELLGRLDQKRRLAPKVGRERGWDPAAVSVWLVVAEGSTNRRRVSAHASVMRAALPADGRSMPAWLRAPAGSIAALSFWSNAQAVGTKQGFAAVRRVRRRVRPAA